MAEQVAGDSALEADILFSVLAPHEMDEQLTRRIGIIALDILANPKLRPIFEETDEIIDDGDSRSWTVRRAVDAAICLLPEPNIVPLSLRSKVSTRVSPEIDRRKINRDGYYDPLVGMKNRAAFELVVPDADSDPSLHFAILDCKGIKELNNGISHKAGSAFIRLTSTYIKLVANRLGMDNDVYIIENDGFAAIGPEGKVGRFINGVLDLISSHIMAGKPLLDWHDLAFPIERYRAIGLDLHVGFGTTYDDAWTLVQGSKDKSDQQRLVKMVTVSN